jgi:type IV pilus assembly protein PilE
METTPVIPFRYQAGYHLVELLAALVILATLLAIALPSYRGYQMRAQRAEAVRHLLTIAQCQEWQRSLQGRYDTTRCLEDIEHTTYRYHLDPPNEPETDTFTVRADPASEAIGKACGSLSLDQSGTRRVSASGAEVSDCWGGR